jgi:hypothetical protein
MSGQDDPRLDRLLKAWEAPPPSGALVARVMADAPQGRASPAAGWLGRLGFGAGLAAASVVGVSVGLWTAERRAEPAEAVSADFAGDDLSGFDGAAEDG